MKTWIEAENIEVQARVKENAVGIALCPGVLLAVCSARGRFQGRKVSGRDEEKTQRVFSIQISKLIFCA